MPDILLTALRDLARNIGGDLTWFADRMDGLPRNPDARANPQPVCAKLDATCTGGTALTTPVRDALLRTKGDLPWTQSYDEGERFDRHYLDNYSMVNVISPEGLYVSNDMRVSFGYWGPGLRYPLHAHEPEEWYVFLTGSCDLTSEGNGTQHFAAGTFKHHNPWQKHAAVMGPDGLLAAAFWRGSGLMDISRFFDGL